MMKPVKRILSACLGGITGIAFAAGALAGCTDADELTITLIDDTQMAECLLGEEYDFEPNIVKQDGVEYSIDVFYFDNAWNKVELETNGMKFTPPVLEEMMITIWAERGSEKEYLDYEMDVTFLADDGEENIVSAWKDTGWSSSVSPDDAYVKVGNSSVKFEFIGEASAGFAIEGSSFLAMTYQTTDYIGMPSISNWYGATVSFWVYNDSDKELEFGLHTDNERGMSGDTMTAAANDWTQITLTYSTDVGSFNYLRMRFADGSADFNGLVFYFDGLTFTNGTGTAPEVPDDPDPVDELMVTSYKDAGTITLNADETYIKEGNSSVKYEFGNGVTNRPQGVVICTFNDLGLGSDITKWIDATVSFWVYNNSATELEFGLHTEGEPEMSGEKATMKAAANDWTQITLTYSKDAGGYNYLRVRDAAGTGEIPEKSVFYIDGLTFTEGTGSGPQEPENPDPVDAVMRESYVDAGISVLLNGDATYIHGEGNSSVKYEYNGKVEKYAGLALCTFYDQTAPLPVDNYAALGADFTNWIGAKVSFWVYNDSDQEIVFGLHTENERDMAGDTASAAANGWTQITLTYSKDPGDFNIFKVRTGTTAFTFYIDELEFTEGTGTGPVEPENPDPVDVAMKTSWTDAGAITLNGETLYIKEGNSSVKYEFDKAVAGKGAGVTICSFPDLIPNIDTAVTEWIGATVSFWVYNDSDTELEFGLSTAGERDMTGSTMKAAANAWTQITLTYGKDVVVDSEEANCLRVRDGACTGNIPAGTVFYIDGLTFTNGTGSEPEEPGEPDPVDVAMVGSYKDDGTISLNQNNKTCIKEGNSSVKYEFNTDKTWLAGATICVFNEQGLGTNVANWVGATVTFWVYNDSDTALQFGLHTQNEPDMTGEHAAMTAAANAWTQITLTYGKDVGEYNYLRVRNADQSGSFPAGTVFYIDGLTFTNGASEPDPIDVTMSESYVDQGIKAEVNPDNQFIHEGGSSVKYTFDGSKEMYHGATLCVMENMDGAITEWKGATVSFWVYNDSDQTLEFGLHTENSPDLQGGVVYAAPGEWTQVTLTYEADPGSFNYLKVRTGTTAFTFYIDGLTFTNGTAA